MMYVAKESGYKSTFVPQADAPEGAILATGLVCGTISVTLPGHVTLRQRRTVSVSWTKTVVTIREVVEAPGVFVSTVSRVRS